MSTKYGTKVLFGLDDVTAVSIASLGYLTHIQSSEIMEEADEEIIKDGTGATKSIVKYDRRAKWNIEFIPSGNTAGGEVQTSYLPTIGQTISVAPNTLYPQIGGVWLVDNRTDTRSNTAALRCRLSLSKYLEGQIP